MIAQFIPDSVFISVCLCVCPCVCQVEKACKLIEELLVVVDDDKNEHKQKQLRELALINGTLKEDEYCSVCAEKGHRCVT